MSTQEQQGPSSSGMPPRSGGPANLAASENPPCPACARPMGLRQVASGLFASGVDELTYDCEKCGTEVKRTVKRT